jgi:periodic tryptophan protein 2
VETRRDIAVMSLSPDGRLLVLVDKDGRCLVVALAKRAVLHRFRFKKRPRALQFSPDGKYLAAGVGRHVQVWRAPPPRRQVVPMSLVRTLTGHFDDVVDIAWAPDSIHLVSASMDATARVYTAEPVPGFVPVTLSGHRAPLVCAAFSSKTSVHTVSADGAAFTWVWEERASLPRDIAATVAGPGKGGLTSRVLDQILDMSLQRDPAQESDDDDDEPTRDDLASDEDEDEDSGDDDDESEDDQSSSRDEASPPRASKRSREEDALPVQHKSTAARATREKHLVPNSATAEGLSIAVGEWVLRGRHLFMQDGARVVSAQYHPKSRMLIAGFDTGVFSLYSLSYGEDVRDREAGGASGAFRTPLTDTGASTAGETAAETSRAASTCDAIHSLSIGTSPITSVAVNPSGEWLALGTAENGQLLVWEWQSESCEYSALRVPPKECIVSKSFLTLCDETL